MAQKKIETQKTYNYKKDIEEIKAILAQMNANLDKLLKILPFGK